MNKRQYCESRESIAYYSGLNGLEIKGGESVYLILLLLLLPVQILIEILKLNN